MLNLEAPWSIESRQSITASHQMLSIRSCPSRSNIEIASETASRMLPCCRSAERVSQGTRSTFGSPAGWDAKDSNPCQPISAFSSATQQGDLLFSIVVVNLTRECVDNAPSKQPVEVGIERGGRSEKVQHPLSIAHEVCVENFQK